MNSMNIHGVTEVNILDDAGDKYIWKNVVIETDSGSFKITLFPADLHKMFEVTEGEPE